VSKVNISIRLTNRRKESKYTEVHSGEYAKIKPSAFPDLVFFSEDFLLNTVFTASVVF
jgi:hypothetical protein